MTTITFDTLKFARRLQQAGVSEIQATAEAEAINEAFSEALNTQVATRQDINKFELNSEKRFNNIENKITLLQWMIALVIAVEIIPLLKTLF